MSSRCARVEVIHQMKMINKCGLLLCGLFLIAAIQPLAASAGEQSTKKAAQTQSEGSAAAERRQVGKGQATRDLVLTIVGLLAFIGLMVFLLRRPKDLDKYEKLYASLEKEKERKEREKEQYTS